jgi:uncharacterized RDD family membrane protein YckC
MKTRRLPCCGLVLALVGLLGSAAIAQDTPPLTGAAPESVARDAVRLGVDYTLSAGSAARDVVVIGGLATIEGHVEGDAVVVLGELHLANTALVDGDIVVIGGTVTVDAGAEAAKDLVVVASALRSPPGFMPGGEQTVIGPPVFGDGLRVLMPWATRGLLWGRPLVPDLPWIWGLIAIVFLVYLVLNFVCDGPVRACVEKLTERPLSTFLVGLLVLALIGPVAVVLAVSVIGLAVIPFMVCALFIAGILGKVGVLRAIGGGVVRQDELDNRAQSARSFVIGFVAVAAMYMVPVLGFVAFGTVGVLGLGAAALVFVAGIRRENPTPPTAPPVLSRYVVAGSLNDVSEPGLPGTEGAVAAVAPPAAMTDLTLLPKATFTIRLGAFVLDLLLVLMTFGLLGMTRPNRMLLLLLLYRVGLWTWMGTTIGGIICQLRIVRTDGAPLRLADALVRGLSSVFSFAVLGIGYLWILKDADRQAWHDKIAGTFVVKVPKHWPLT